ncbi:MAG: HXXEE domain-containing protein [Solirubrobacterales bacterium]|nr:HXXEE domain-containing protein [Solirubrobacterales bacterium]
MDIDSHSWVLWIGVIAAALHVIEEYSEGWVTWANYEFGPRFGITVTEKDFLLGSAALIFIALAGAAIGWWAPAISLAVPALFILNAVFSHMLPSARGDRLTPGTLSAVFIYLPVAVWMFWAADQDGKLDFGTFLGAFVIGAALMAYPLVVLLLKTRIGWDEETVTAATEERKAETARKEELTRMQAEQELRAATPPVEELPRLTLRVKRPVNSKENWSKSWTRLRTNRTTTPR